MAGGYGLGMRAARARGVIPPADRRSDSGLENDSKLINSPTKAGWPGQAEHLDIRAIAANKGRGDMTREALRLVVAAVRC